MQDLKDIIDNMESIYNSTASFTILKDFERVLDNLDIYVYPNWEDGELVSGPKVERHWVTCSFMWDLDNMPDPSGGMRLIEYGCKVSFKKSQFVSPRKIKDPSDYRPGTKKPKLDAHPIWIVTIKMPKELIGDIYSDFIGDIKAEVLDDYSNVSDMSVTDSLDDVADGDEGDALDNLEGL